MALEYIQHKDSELYSAISVGKDVDEILRDMKMILTISVISDDNTRNELSSFGFDDVDEAKRNYSDYLQSLYKDCMDKGYPIDFDYTYVFDKNNGITVVNVLDPSASEEAGKQIMHRYNVILSTPQDDSQI